MAATREPRFQKRPAARTGELLTAALEVFAANGYRATRLEEVAVRAGVSKATIYLYFRTKEDLLVQSLNHHLRRANEERPSAAELREGSCRSRLEGALRKMWNAAHDPDWARLYHLVLGEVITEHPTVFRAFVRNGMVPVWDLLSAIVEEGQASGEFRADVSAPDVVRVLVTGLMQQAYMEVHTEVRNLAPADTDRMLSSSLRIFLDGLHPR